MKYSPCFIYPPFRPHYSYYGIVYWEFKDQFYIMGKGKAKCTKIQYKERKETFLNVYESFIYRTSHADTWKCKFYNCKRLKTSWTINILFNDRKKWYYRCNHRGIGRNRSVIVFSFKCSVPRFLTVAHRLYMNAIPSVQMT